jgi:hypothetical protein
MINSIAEWGMATISDEFGNGFCGYDTKSTGTKQK